MYEYRGCGQGLDGYMGNGRSAVGRGKGYRILEIYEVYEYQVTQYNHETGQGVLFVDYINTFLKLKGG